MKKFTTLLVIMSLCITIVCAQQLKINSTVRAKHSSYKVNESKFGSIDVENEKNSYYQRHPKQNYNLAIEKTDKLSTINDLKQVFSSDRLRQLVSEPAIGIKYYVSPEGKILEISFILKKNTLVTAGELEKLEDALKANVSFKFNNNQINTGDFIVIYQTVHFSKVLDGTLLN